jgi:Ca2+-binding EF-hand superfamily protein
MDDTAQLAFDLFDKEHKGQFTFEAFIKVAKSVGENWSVTEMREMFDIADKNQDGYIDQSEFMDVMERVGLS